MLGFANNRIPSNAVANQGTSGAWLCAEVLTSGMHGVMVSSGNDTRSARRFCRADIPTREALCYRVRVQRWKILGNYTACACGPCSHKSAREYISSHLPPMLLACESRGSFDPCSVVAIHHTLEIATEERCCLRHGPRPSQRRLRRRSDFVTWAVSHA